MEKDTSSKQKQVSEGSNTQIRQYRLENKAHTERQRRALYNDKGIDTRRGYYTH